MTYQQKFEELRKEFAEASDKYIKADKALSEANGFADTYLIDNFANTKKAFEITGNNYHQFILSANKNKVRSEDEFGQQ